jgi:hypothetical protein
MIFSSLFFLSFSSLIHYNQQITDFFSLDNKTSRSPYFNALISGDPDMKYVQRKMVQLPGVEKVLVKNKLDAKAELAKVIPGLDIDEALAASSFRPIKIFLEADITKSSRQLIREYLTRLMGKESVSFSAIKYPTKVNLKKYPYFKIFSDWSGYYFAFLAFGLWIMMTILLSPYFHQQAYIIEKFQRTRHVALKMYATYVLSLTSLVVISLNLSNIKFDSLIVYAVLILCISFSIIIFNLAKNSSRRII